jgi:hypothetical protein
MKIMSYSSIVLAGALCLTFGSIASAADEKTSSTKKAPTKSSAAGKATVATAVVPDQVIYVNVTGSLIPQRYIVRNGQIINASSNTQMILLNGGLTSSNSVGGILAQNVPDITIRGSNR